MASLDGFFRPESVAVIGASRDPRKPGHVIFRNFLEGNFKGKVYPVNPNAEALIGRKCYPSVMDIEGRIDLAVIVVPAEAAIEAMEDCGRKGIKNVVVNAGGFRETGNSQLEEQLVKAAKKHVIKFIGPNTLGIFDAHSGVDTLFNPKYKLERPQAGGISFISQSGAIMSVVLDWMSMKGYKASKFISYGNAADIDESDLMEYLASDSHTKVICIYIEGAKNGRKFFDAAKRVSGRKPIIALKGGKTEEGGKAVSSHTGSLAGQAAIYSAAFRQAGIIEADDIEQLFDFARMVSSQPAANGNRVQIITDGGGFGILFADNMTRNGLRLARMADVRLEDLRKHLPEHAVVGSIIDLTGDVNAERYGMCISAALDDELVDMIVVIALFQVPALTGEIVEVVAEAARERKKPIAFIAAGGRFTEVLKKSLEDYGVPTFSYPERAAAALKALSEHSMLSR